MQLAVREMGTRDIGAIVRYWTTASAGHLAIMGVDPARLPSADQWRARLHAQITAPLPEKESFCLIWEIDGQPVGHNNIDRIRPGQDAFMHLHMWEAAQRQKGLGVEFVRLCLPHFFRAYDLQQLFCQPNADNVAPNKTLKRAGFTFVKTFRTVPGFLNFEQPVNQWVFKAGQLPNLNQQSVHGPEQSN